MAGTVVDDVEASGVITLVTTRRAWAHRVRTEAATTTLRTAPRPTARRLPRAGVVIRAEATISVHLAEAVSTLAIVDRTATDRAIIPQEVWAEPQHTTHLPGPRRGRRRLMAEITRRMRVLGMVSAVQEDMLLQPIPITLTEDRWLRRSTRTAPAIRMEFRAIPIPQAAGFRSPLEWATVREVNADEVRRVIAGLVTVGMAMVVEEVDKANDGKGIGGVKIVVHWSNMVNWTQLFDGKSGYRLIEL